IRTAVARAPMAFHPFPWMQLPREGCAKIQRLRAKGRLRWSLRDLALSIEMNTKIPLAATNMIEFRDVSFHINDIPARVIVSGISLEIPHGETLVLLGRSGSGKTTLLKLMNGLLLPTKGEILVQDRPTTSWDAIRLRRGIGYVIQDAGLFPHFTVAENVGLVPSLERWDAPRIAARVEEMLHLVGLDPREFARTLRRPASTRRSRPSSRCRSSDSAHGRTVRRSRSRHSRRASARIRRPGPPYGQNDRLRHSRSARSSSAR